MKRLIEPGHLEELGEWGFTVLEGLVSERLLARFEQQIAELVAAQLNRLGLVSRREDPFIDLFSLGGAYRRRFYVLLERLAVLHRMSASIADRLEKEGFFVRTGMKVPLVWPDIRADLPGDAEPQLPVHQDYKSTQCANAYRLWIPLRPSGQQTGTMCAYRGTHQLGPVSHELGDPVKPTVDPALYDRAEKVVFDLPAGNGVLIDPLLFHASVPNRSTRTKFTLMVQIQDMATMIDPSDDTYGAFARAVTQRRKAEVALGG